MEKIPIHHWFHTYSTADQSILEIPSNESTGNRIKRMFKIGGIRRFFAQSFSRNGLLTTDQLEETKNFIASISSDTAPYSISSIYLTKPSIFAYFRLDFEAWGHLLSAVKDTVTEIRLENIDLHFSASDQSILPIPIPNLRQLVVDGSKIHLTRRLLENLAQCRKLENVSVELDIEQENVECLSALNRIGAAIDIQYWIWLRRDNTDRIFDEDGFKGLELIADKITSFSLCIDSWDDRLPSAMTKMVARCQNLIKLAIKKLDPCKKGDGTDRNVESALIPLFSSPERAQKFVEFRWAGECNNEVLRLIFSNCLQLDSLAISDCPQLSDMSFFDWWWHSHKPHIFKILRYDSDETIRSITASSNLKSQASKLDEECEDCAGLLFMELIPRQVRKKKAKGCFC